MRLSGLELQQATRGTWHHNAPDSVHGIQTDTRNFLENQAFLALRGPNFDGHAFAHQVAHKAQALIGDTQGLLLWDAFNTPQLEVENTQVALGDIAHAWRNRLNHTTIIAITGSYGKTTVRSMLAHVFQSLDFKIAATHANLNNLIGVPMTLLSIAEDTDIALVECGISEAGEMQRLSEIVQPDIAVITGLTAAHAEGLGGVDGVIREKSQIFKHLLPQGWCALGQGVLEQMQAYISHEVLENKTQWQLQGTTLRLSNHQTSTEFTLGLPAKHWAENMALVADIVLQYCHQHHRPVSLELLGEILAQWQAVHGRMQQHQGENGAIILDDSYNANPVSMQAALNTLANMPKRRVAILGDMAELGEHSAQAHSQLDISHVDELILVGTYMQALHKQQPASQWFANTDSLAAWLEANPTHFTQQDTVLIKASRSMCLDRIVSMLVQQGGLHAV